MSWKVEERPRMVYMGTGTKTLSTVSRVEQKGFVSLDARKLKS